MLYVVLPGVFQLPQIHRVPMNRFVGKKEHRFLIGPIAAWASTWCKRSKFPT